MNKEEIDKYKIRDYYMIPVEVVDNIFYSFEQQNQKYKEVIEKIRKEINDEYSIMGVKVVQNDTLEEILKEV